mmetsp:Transcript_35734/g.47018  ORF Transcript_35734/g.47018 Transcript_35734/m.47018 type:complete len:245 (-) Transcript_35734:797-1531(-)
MQEYLDESSPERTSSYDPSMDETMKVSIGASMRMDDTIDSMGLERKTRFAGYIVDYIENNLPRYASLGESKPSLFDRSRENRTDRELKFRLIRKFNERPSRFPNSNFNNEFDLGIACDLLFDLFRYEDAEILNPSVVVQDFKQSQKNGTLYNVKDFYKRIKSNFFVLIIKELFKLIVRAKELKQFKSCSQVGVNLADALIAENQSDMKVELSKVLRNIIAIMSGSIDESTVGALSASVSNSALN